jgi:hypothetical protein
VVSKENGKKVNVLWITACRWLLQRCNAVLKERRRGHVRRRPVMTQAQLVHVDDDLRTDARPAASVRRGKKQLATHARASAVLYCMHTETSS